MKTHTNFINLSTHQLTPSQENTLDLGLKYTIQPNKSISYITKYKKQINLIKRKLFYKQFFAEKNQKLPPIPPNIPSRLLKKHWTSKKIDPNKLPPINTIAKTQIDNFLTEIFNNITTKILYHYRPPKTTNIHLVNIKQLNSLQEQHIIKITKSDKTNQLVVLNYNDYHQTALDHLSNTKFYQPTTINTTQIHQTLQNNFNHIIFLFKKHPNLPHIKATLDYIHPKNVTNTQYLPHIYFNAKTHKTPLSYRPIISGEFWITQKAAILIDETLKNILTTNYQYIPKDTFDFLNKINNLQHKLFSLHNPQLQLVTFDITSLYTNIPQNTCSQRVQLLIQRHLPNNTIPPEFFKHLTDWILNNNYFTYNKTTYKQTYGIAMGCVAGGSLANTYLTFWEHDLLNNQFCKDNLLAYYRYFDDGFILWNGSILHLDHILDTLNTTDPNIKITATHGTTIQYLDVELNITNTNYILTRPYRKPTSNDTYLNPNSCHPKHIFNNIPYNIFFRTFIISNTIQTYKIHIAKYTKNLIKSGYQKTTIEQSLKKLEYKYNITNDKEQYINSRNQTILKITNKQPTYHYDNERVILPITHWPNLKSSDIINNWQSKLQNTFLSTLTPLRAHSQLPPLQRQLIHHK